MRGSMLLYSFTIMSVVLSCKDGSLKKHRSDSIDRDKIDKIFGADVSEIRFDHLYVVLDSSSYERLKFDDSWNNQYAATDNGLPYFDPTDSTMTSCYLRGHEHFIELLGPNNKYNEPVGKSGIGFSLRNKGEHFHLGVIPKLKQPETPYLSLSDTVAMSFGANSTTWFKAFYSPGQGTSLHTWYAFYNPVFLDSLYQTEHKEYSRKAFLKKSYDKKQLFNGIKSIHMSCTPQDYQRIAQEMRQLGCALIAKENQTLTIASGDIAITLSPSKDIAFSRINHVECRLNALDSSIIKLGNITITNVGTESIWNLENLYNNNP